MEPPRNSPVYPVLVFEIMEGRRGITAGFPSAEDALRWLGCIADTPNFNRTERSYEVRAGSSTLAKVTLPARAAAQEQGAATSWPPTPDKEALDCIIEAASRVTQIWFGEAWADPTAPDSDFNSEMDKLTIALQELRR